MSLNTILPEVSAYYPPTFKITEMKLLFNILLKIYIVIADVSNWSKRDLDFLRTKFLLY